MQLENFLCLSCLSALEVTRGPPSEGKVETCPTRGQEEPALRPQKCGSVGGPQRAARGPLSGLAATT